MNTFRDTDSLSLLTKEIDRRASDEVGSECADVGTSRRANRDGANAHCRRSATGNMGRSSDESRHAPPAASRLVIHTGVQYQAPVVYVPEDLFSSLFRRTSLTKMHLTWRRSRSNLLISDLEHYSRTGTADRCFDEAQASPLYDLMAEVGYSVITPYSFAYASRPAPLEDPFIDDPFVDEETPAISSVTHLPQPSDSDTKARITSWLDAVDPIVAPPRPPSPDLYPLEPMGSSSNSTPHEDAALAAPAAAVAAAAAVSRRVTVTVLGPGFIGRMPRPATVEFQALLLAGLLAVLLAPRMTLILVCSVSLSRLGEKGAVRGRRGQACRGDAAPRMSWRGTRPGGGWVACWGWGPGDISLWVVSSRWVRPAAVLFSGSVFDWRLRDGSFGV
ncbi:predicted protein [Verticillium alfalfae VaMs.102]|uniref:Predicted protein n=1 Tax=Verticillium alfalfae (strain VaMs.102 / ATCC MYA-4576 / FGSC 10136) TaxID=526221 RepID=C9S9Q6_VERA1|nr:predicted protein [Verticillium alfalfae VaMs.102]EEY16119.1 predicted protein [Verticillium alfalfae VaMs.102]